MTTLSEVHVIHIRNEGGLGVILQEAIVGGHFDRREDAGNLFTACVNQYPALSQVLLLLGPGQAAATPVEPGDLLVVNGHAYAVLPQAGGPGEPDYRGEFVTLSTCRRAR